MSSNFLVFHASEGILERLAVFLLLIFVSIMSSFSSINCPSLISSWSLISFYRFISDFRGVSKQILEMFFHFCIFLLGWQFLLLLSRCSSFHSLHLLSAMLFMIIYLLPRFLFYWFGLECILVVLFVCVTSFWVFLSFSALSFVWFLILSKDTIFMLSFFLATSDSHGTQHLALSLVCLLLLFPLKYEMKRCQIYFLDCQWLYII